MANVAPAAAVPVGVTSGCVLAVGDSWFRCRCERPGPSFPPCQAWCAREGGHPGLCACEFHFEFPHAQPGSCVIFSNPGREVGRSVGARPSRSRAPPAARVADAPPARSSAPGGRSDKLRVNPSLQPSAPRSSASALPDLAPGEVGIVDYRDVNGLPLEDGVKLLTAGFFSARSVSGSDRDSLRALGVSDSDGTALLRAVGPPEALGCPRSWRRQQFRRRRSWAGRCVTCG